MEEIKQSLRDSQKSLEERLKKRDEQVEILKKKYEDRKVRNIQIKINILLIEKYLIKSPSFLTLT